MEEDQPYGGLNNASRQGQQGSRGCGWLLGHLHLCPSRTRPRQVMSDKCPAQSCRQEGCCLPTPWPPAITWRWAAGPPNRTRAAGLHGHLPVHPISRMLLYVVGCFCQCTAGMVPVQCPASSQSQWQNEMSGTCPRPGCAPAARHSRVSPQTEHSRCPATSPAAGSSISRLVPCEWECPLGVWAVSVLLYL